ncbi:Sulfotransferase [Thalictrum thalictroides]|uniref:Sulfotransferase n=1 Tax=Thalictrum thalictroides TaxID=46969 RepID=A0A7J6VPP3_THATH|nr:Sulfotransferase [Thalictrum thalictroides]
MTTTQASLLPTSDFQDISILVSKLPKQIWFGHYELCKWEGSWYSPPVIEGALAAQSHFEARDDDIIIASSMKVGTTWLKSLIPSIMNCTQGNDHDDPLIAKNPHNVVHTLELQVYPKKQDISTLPSPRILHTHLPYNSLPDSIKNSNCKIVYIARNPKDVFVSLWHFMNKLRTEDEGPFPIEEAFENFCSGAHFYGPYLDHVLEYWNKSRTLPHKILFLKYEEMKRNPKEHVGNLASFLGKPFANNEELEIVLWRSSFGRLKNLEVNKSGTVFSSGFPNSSFFRLGTTGDWKNYFTPEMQECLDEIVRLKYEGTGLDLEI